MTKYFLSFLFFFAFSATALVAQKDHTLFTVDKEPVKVSEFRYIYSKTNGDKADFSEESLKEYLDLYVKFKLKVKKAKALQLDTIPTLKKELEGYRRQLADSYLIDKGVSDRLVEEAYERVQQDVDISHILIGVDKKASPQDTLKAYNEALEIKKQIEAGAKFEDKVKAFSDDPSKKSNNGHIGYVTALFPKGLYALENVAYTAPEGKLVGPVRTKLGYHLVIVHGKRPARGEMEVAHILIRKDDANPKIVEKKIKHVHKLLSEGGDFGELAAEYSQDKRTATNKGYIGFFGINRYEPSFENAAFAIAKDGEYSAPIETSSGWHIIKRISKKEIQPFNIEKSRLNRKIQEDDRFVTAKASLLSKIKSENNFTQDDKVLQDFIAVQNDTFLTFRWKPTERPQTTLFTIGEDEKVSLGEFMDYLIKSSRERLRYGRNDGIEKAVQNLYSRFVDDRLLQYEEKHLSEKYPEFKSLMREYEEGILLFEVTKQEVWDKASKDSTGLRKFFNDRISHKYMWAERAECSVYQVPAKYKDKMKSIQNFVKTHKSKETLVHYNKGSEVIVTLSDAKFEKVNRGELGATPWEVGAVSDIIELPTGNLKVLKIEKIVPATPKKLEEARGYAIADYQDYLEKQWVEQLRDEYKVKINNKVLKTLIK